MRLLVLGGTRFLGRHLVDAALARGDAVTLFTRGKQPTHWGGAVTTLSGNRDPKSAPGLAAAREPDGRVVGPARGGGGRVHGERRAAAPALTAVRRGPALGNHASGQNLGPRPLQPGRAKCGV